MSLLAINHIHYRRPLRPCVAVCIDGSDPSYRAFHPGRIRRHCPVLRTGLHLPQQHVHHHGRSRVAARYFRQLLP